MISLTIFDIITLSIIAVSSLLGLYRGFVHILVNLIGFIASVVAAIMLYPYVNILFIGHIENELGILVLSGAVAYIISLVFFTFLTSKTILLLKEHSRGIFDRISGLAAGAVRGVVFSVVIFVFIAVFTSGTYLKADNLHEAVANLKKEYYPVWLKESPSVRYYEDITKASISVMPPEWLESIKMPGTEKKEENKGDKDIIDSIKKKKNKDGVSSSINIPVDEDLEKNIDEMGL